RAAFAIGAACACVRRCFGARCLAVGEAHAFARAAVAASVAAATTATVAARLARLAAVGFAFARRARPTCVVVGSTEPIVVGRGDRIRTGVARLTIRSSDVALAAADVVAVAIAAAAATAPPPTALTLARRRRLVALRQGVGECGLHRLLWLGGGLGDRRFAALGAGSRVAARFATRLAALLATRLAALLATRLGTIAIAPIAPIAPIAAVATVAAIAAIAAV